MRAPMTLRRLALALGLWLAAGLPAGAQVFGPGTGPIGLSSSQPSFALPASVAAFNFLSDQGFIKGRGIGSSTAFMVVSRGSGATDLLPISPAGQAYTTYLTNVPVRNATIGLCSFEQRTNLLLNSASPATQTVTLSGTGSYTLWVNGSGSATIAAGTAAGSNFGSATTGNWRTISITAAGTVTITVTGSLQAFQLEAGSFPTLFIITAGASSTRAADSLYIPSIPAPSYATLFAAGLPLASSNIQMLSTLSDGTTNNILQIYRAGTGVASNLVIGSVGAASASGTWATGILQKNATQYTASQIALGYGGLKSVGMGSIAASAFTRLSIGSQNGTGSNFNGCISYAAVQGPSVDVGTETNP